MQKAFVFMSDSTLPFCGNFVTTEEQICVISDRP